MIHRGSTRKLEAIAHALGLDPGDVVEQDEEGLYIDTSGRTVRRAMAAREARDAGSILSGRSGLLRFIVRVMRVLSRFVEGRR